MFIFHDDKQKNLLYRLQLYEVACERGVSTPPKNQYILKNRLPSKTIKVFLELGGDLYGVKTYVKSKILTSR